VARGGGNRSRLLLVLLLVSSLFLITLDLRGVNLAGSIRGSVATVFSPVETLFSRLFSPIGNFAGDIRNIGQANEKIERLNKELELLKSKEILDEDMVGQLNQLKNILDLAGRGGYKVVAAKVINRGSSATFKETITIDVGSSSSDGGRPFVPGVPVGTVVEVQSNSSSITQNADVTASANLDRIGIVAVVVSPPKFDPRDSLIPKPNPTVTVYVTPSPTPAPSN